jgi:ATP phosphoribosyltransferase
VTEEAIVQPDPLTQSSTKRRAAQPVQTPLTIALPKGRLADETLALMAAAGLSLPEEDTGRKLILPSGDGTLNFILAKPSDVPTMVEYGAASIGVCGLDTLRESRRNVYEPLLLPFGYCRLCVAGMADRAEAPLRYESQPRIATKYPRITGEYFRARGVNAEIIQLNGSVELAPLVGLADLIVDLVETGNTLRANGLRITFMPPLCARSSTACERRPTTARPPTSQRLRRSPIPQTQHDANCLIRPDRRREIHAAQSLRRRTRSLSRDLPQRLVS